MKHILGFIAVAVIAFSCTEQSIAPQAPATGGNAPLNKCIACTVNLKVTDYYRSADSTWCVGLRVFRDDGSSIPLTGGYTWYRDTTACDSTNSWIHYADSVKCLTVSGLSDVNRPMSRFAFKAVYNGYETPRIIVGKDMRWHSITGCLADPCSAADSTFRLSTITCDSLRLKQ